MGVREQVRITLPGALREEVDAIRARWNPELVPGNPAHATVVYHDEAEHPALLRERLAAAVAELAPFELVLGSAQRFRPPAEGVYLAVSDPAGAVERLRRAVLAPPFTPRARLVLHVTLIHPAFGERAGAAWPELAALRFGCRFPVEGLELISGDRRGLETTGFPLRISAAGCT